MLTQELNKYKYQGYISPAFPQQQRQVYPDFNRPCPAMDKLEYAKFLKDLGYEKGDFVTYVNNQLPYSEYSVNLVMDIIEIHYMVKEWGTGEMGPRMVYLADPWRPHHPPGRVTTYLAHGARYKKVPLDQVPEKCRAYANARTDSIQESA